MILCVLLNPMTYLLLRILERVCNPMWISKFQSEFFTLIRKLLSGKDHATWFIWGEFSASTIHRRFELKVCVLIVVCDLIKK